MTAPDVTPTQPLTDRPAWKALQEHYQKIRNLHLRQIFADDPGRGTRLTADAAGLYLDYSKHRVTDETLRLLLRLAEERGLAERIEAMFGGRKINATEQRAVLHVALRAPLGERIVVDGVDVVPHVHAVLDRMAAFADDVRDGRWMGHTGRPIRNVVNIGIGGSDLGPVMAYEAMRHYSRRDMTFRFVSNVDGTDFVEATRDLGLVKSPRWGHSAERQRLGKQTLCQLSYSRSGGPDQRRRVPCSTIGSAHERFPRDVQSVSSRGLSSPWLVTHSWGGSNDFELLR